MLSVVLFVVVCFVWGCATGVSADDQGCYTPGGVAGIVIATVVVTLIMGGLAVAFVWYLWKQRKGVCSEVKSQDKPISCPTMSPDKQLIVREKSDYAFDNPYFKDDETDTATPDAAEKGESGFHVDNGDIAPAQNAKASSNGTSGQAKKNRPFSSLPFHAVFHPSGKKQRATMDDTYISKHLERVTVPLRGHDFTGLGFNICGNMRDGIFVKDVLHRGPASESGKIKAGDRIVGVTVSFGAMVYEDALTILSYASPYDVRLEIEKCATADPLPPSHSPKRLGGTSTSFRSSDGRRRLFHPLYRSQSIDDLTQIGKEGFLMGSNSICGSQRDSSSSATPKRSQSVEASNGGPKARSAYALTKVATDEGLAKTTSSAAPNKGSRKSSISSCGSAGKVIAVTDPCIENNQQAAKEEGCSKKEIKSSRFKVEQIHVKSEVPPAQHKQVPSKPARESAADEKLVTQIAEDVNEKSIKIDKQVDEVKEAAIPVETPAPDSERPTAPPRKAGTPAKRRAPAPPKTEAQVHRPDEQLPDVTATEPDPTPTVPDAAPSEPPAPPTSEVPEFPTLPVSPPLSEPDMGSSDNSSLASRGAQPQKEPEPSSPGKRKASSLGDLTKLDPGARGKASTASAILERAVSLDLQQSLPGENLIKQKKILRAPTFEDDYDENKEGDLNEVDAPALKRWDDGLDKVLGGLTNGDVDLNDAISFEVDKGAKPAEDASKDAATNLFNDMTAMTSRLFESDFTITPNKTSVPNDEEIVENQVTSTPARKVIEVKDFLKDDDDSMDDIPYLASAIIQKSAEDASAAHSTVVKGPSVSVLSPVTISIPVIKPDLTHYEKLPSPPPASTHPALDSSWRITSKTTSSLDESSRSPLERMTNTKTSSDESSRSPLDRMTTSSSLDESGKSALERISVQSLYRPIFSSKEYTITDDVTLPETNNNSTSESSHKSTSETKSSFETSISSMPEKLVNGNDSDSSEHYSTAQENTTASSVENNSTLSVTLSSPVIGNNVALKAPSNVAGFAKTLIIPGPNEVENLLSLAQEPNTPPPNSEPPPNAVSYN